MLPHARVLFLRQARKGKWAPRKHRLTAKTPSYSRTITGAAAITCLLAMPRAREPASRLRLQVYLPAEIIIISAA